MGEDVGERRRSVGRRTADEGNLHAQISEDAMALLNRTLYSRKLAGERISKGKIVEECLRHCLNDGNQGTPMAPSGYSPERADRIE